MERPDRRIAAAIGAELRRIRETAGWRQDDVARHARKYGLKWTGSVVATLEAGRRYLTVDELDRLPMVLEDMGLNDPTGRLEFGGAPTALAIGRRSWQFPLFEAPPPGDVELARKMAADLWPEATAADIEAAAVDQAGEAEQKAARRLPVKIPPIVVALGARMLWGRSLTAERDHRANEAWKVGGTLGVPQRDVDPTRDDLPPVLLQATGLRGRATRLLLAELEPFILRSAGRLLGPPPTAVATVPKPDPPRRTTTSSGTKRRERLKAKRQRRPSRRR